MTLKTGIVAGIVLAAAIAGPAAAQTGHSLTLSGPSAARVGQPTTLQATGTVPQDVILNRYLNVYAIPTSVVASCPPTFQSAIQLSYSSSAQGGDTVALAVPAEGNFAIPVAYTPSVPGQFLLCGYLHEGVETMATAQHRVGVSAAGGAPGAAKPTSLRRPKVTRAGGKLVCARGACRRASTGRRSGSGCPTYSRTLRVRPARAAAAASRLDTREARFRVTVEGKQTTRWSANHMPQFRCDSRYTGSGTETVRFRSRRAKVARAFVLGNGPIMWTVDGDTAYLPMKASVTRRGSMSHAPVVPECAVGDGDGSGEPPASDCGTKRIRALKLLLQYDFLRRDRITLSSDGQATPRFEQCPMLGEGWTTIVSRDDRGRTAGESLPRRDLFDRRQRKMIVIGRGTVSSNVNGIRSKTRVEWMLTLVRRR